MNMRGFTMSSKHPTYGEQGLAPFRKRTWLRILVLFGFGGMIVTVLCLLSGCGSDSKPEAVSGKKEKTAASPKAMKSQAAVPLNNLGGGSGGTVKREPLSPETELAPGLTVGEVEKRNAATRKRVEDPDYELIPGITKKELDDKIAAEQKRLESGNSASQEILPGITKQNLDAKMAAHLKMTGSSNGGLSGSTKEDLNARLDADRIKRELNHEVLPGVFKDKLDTKLRQSEKQ
jgi:hypothetical protein